MSKAKLNEPDIDLYGNAIRFFLKGNTIGDYEKGLEKVFDRLSQLAAKTPENGGETGDEDYYLQTFTNVMYRDELQFFLGHGFFIHNVMLFMELDIRQFADNNTELVNEAFKEGIYMLEGSDAPVYLESYDTSGDLSEYLKANALGFGEPDPVNQLKEELSYGNAAIYVARHRGKIVSSITVWDLDNETVATENIFTVPGYREKGLAGSLLARILLIKSVNGMKKARLSVFGDDYEAISLYYKLGFTLVSEKYELRY